MNLFSWLAGRARYEVNELVAPSPRGNFEFRNEPEQYETCAHGFEFCHPADYPWEVTYPNMPPAQPYSWAEQEAEFNRALAEARANDNRRHEQEL